MKTRSSSEYFYTLDIARSVAAVAVLFWHYQHFFWLEGAGNIPIPRRGDSPLYWLFGAFFEHGDIAVQIFWMLSGFVISSAYFTTSASGRSFFIARFARLYPLHLLTLFVVLLLQMLSVNLFGYSQIYNNNDLYHFILQIFFISDWGFQNSYSFNGPIWSVSIEVIFYIVFWLVVPLLRSSKYNFALIFAFYFWSLAFFIGSRFFSIFECGFYFFSGVAVYKTYVTQHVKPGRLLLTGLMALAMGISIFLNMLEFARPYGVPLIALGILGISLALHTVPMGKLLKFAQTFGNLTYGTYLWHIPLQIIALIWIQLTGESWVIYSPYFLAAFIFVTLAVAAVSYRYFELPMRLRLRSTLK